MIDAEGLVIAHLRERLEVRVGTKIPKDTGDPFIQVRLIDPSVAPGLDDIDHLIRYQIDLHCYAGGPDEGSSTEAFGLAQSARRELFDIPPQQEGALVSAVRFGPCPHLPDDQFTPQRERYVLTAFVYARPR